jgi:uncharacterized membrane protein YedE/YeeE
MVSFVTDFTPVPALLGGLLIGLSASLLLLSHGRIAGISGFLGSLVSGPRSELGFRLSFLAGLVSVGLVAGLIRGFPDGPATPIALTALAGFLVGFGSRLGNGCTSGHGVCGNSRLAPRSLIATLMFIASGAITVWIVRHLAGGTA